MKKIIKEEIKTKEKGTSKAFSVYMKIEVHNKIKMYKQAHGTKSINEAIEELVEKGLEYSIKTEQKYINVLTDLREQSKFNNQKIIDEIDLIKKQNDKLLKDTNWIKAMINKGLSAVYGVTGAIFGHFYHRLDDEETNQLNKLKNDYSKEMPNILRGNEHE
jgi:hypothetical protein